MSSAFSQRRSRSVFWAGCLLFVAAALAVVHGLAGVVPIGALGEMTNNAYTEAGVADAARYGEAVQADVLVGLLIDVLLAVAFLGFGLVSLLLGGRGAARIGTWLAGGLGVLWFGYGMFGTASGSLVTRTSGLSAGGADTAKINREIAEHTPGWVAPVQTTLAVVILLALVLVILLRVNIRATGRAEVVRSA